MSHVTLHIGMQSGTPYGDVHAVNVECETGDDAAVMLRELASYIEEANEEGVPIDSIIDNWARGQLETIEGMESDEDSITTVSPEEPASQLRALAADLEDVLLRMPARTSPLSVWREDTNTIRTVADELLILADNHAGPEEASS